MKTKNNSRNNLTKRLIKVFKKILLILLNIILPKKCICCGKTLKHGYFCEDCYKNKLEFIREPYCKKCGSKIFVKNISIDKDKLICLDCLRNTNYFDKSLSVFIYNKTIADTIYLFKMRNGFALSKFFYIFLNKKIKEFNDKIDYIIPVPMSIKKLRKRGYNHTILLIREFEKNKNYKIIYDLLDKHKPTADQKNLPYKLRLENVKNSFSVNKKYLDLVKNKNILIIDDVFTTGSTLNECAKTLKRKGATKVFTLTIAKTVVNR